MGGSLLQILEGFYISGGPSDMHFPLTPAIIGRDSQRLGNPIDGASKGHPLHAWANDLLRTKESVIKAERHRVAYVPFLFEFAILKTCAPERVYYTAVDTPTTAYRPPILKLGVTVN